MSHRHLPVREPPRHPRSTERWLASEWGLAALALVLAVLVWAVVWGHISSPAEFEVGVEFRYPKKGYVAYADGDVVFQVRGPRGELEEARKALGSHVVAHLRELAPDEEFVTQVPVSVRGRYELPFPPRLIVDIEEPQIEMYRLRPQTLQIQEVEIEGVPDGYRAEVEIEQRTVVVYAAADKLKSTIEPDPISVAELFQAYQDGSVPPPQEKPLIYDGWRRQGTEGRYRADLDIPEVKAVVRFFYDKSRQIRNRIEFIVPDKFEVTSYPDVVEYDYYKGSFLGPLRELDSLESSPEEWWYVVRIPRGALLDKEGEERTVNGVIEYVDVRREKRSRVALQSRVEVLVGVTRREE